MNKTFKEVMKDALINAIGKKPDYEIIIAAGDWVKLKVFTEADVIEIQTAIDTQYATVEETTTESEV